MTANSRLRRHAFRAASARAILTLYKQAVSPVLHAAVPGACRFQPTCSEYAAIAIAEHGVLRGGFMSIGRLLRCHPLHRGGFDPVPAKPALIHEKNSGGALACVPQIQNR
jgi:uncharacterized protein